MASSTSAVLFEVTRNWNANKVQYVVSLDPRTQAATGVDAHWVMLEKDASGRCIVPLTTIERKFMYGIKPLTSKRPGRLMFCMVAKQEMVMTVFRSGSRWRAGTTLPSGNAIIITAVHGNISGTMLTGLSITGKLARANGKLPVGAAVTEVIKLNLSISLPTL
jgi:hypothetical protein